MTFAACKKDEEPDTDPSTSDFDRTALLANLGDNIIMPRYRTFEQDVIAMDDAADAFITDRSYANLTAVRGAWKQALLSWQYVAMFEFGPAEQQSLRSSINIYPTDTAQILDNVNSGSYNLEAASNIDAKGFQGMDYLLHGIGADDVETILLYDAGSSQNLRQYLQDLSENIRTKVSATVQAWEPGGGNYIASFKSNDGTDVGSSLGMLLNSYTMHFEVYLRDGKIGIPAGARTFTQTPLPDKVEAYYHGNSSVEFAHACMTAYYDIYLGRHPDGTNGEGLDDYLVFLDAQHTSGPLNDAIKDQTVICLSAIAACNDPLKDEVVNNQAVVMNAFDEMQQLVVLYKVDMMSTLGILITYVDNDGD